LYYSSYYDRIGNVKSKTETNYENYDKFNNYLESIIPNYKLNHKIKNLIIKKDNEEELEPEYLYFKLKEDMPKLEKYIQDPKYRKELEEEQNSGIEYTFYENYELIDLLGLEKKVKEKLKIPENSIIKYESIKCSKKCKHKTHKYFYAYFWDPLIKKLRKKYIGKHLPYPFSFNIIIRNEEL
jgi:hypothetical protein